MSGTTHHYQCDFWHDQYPHECNCGLTGARLAMMDFFPHDRPATLEESKAAWRALDEKMSLAK